ncbi:MAG: DNA alkylation repair protein [Albidovulum sp.]|nr:DNA alkylation repair protein [Albidovulum sp.]
MDKDARPFCSDHASNIRNCVMAAMRNAANPARARQQQQYMKSDMPYYGVGVPNGRRIAQYVFRMHALPDAEAWEASILCLWRKAAYREERYAAIDLLHFKRYRSWLEPARIPLVEELVVTGAWWDYVDAIAGRAIGDMLIAHPRPLRSLLRHWASDRNIWKRRAAILSQLRAKQATDTSLLADTILPSIGETEFFLRKGIGWALREYSKTSPHWVLEFVANHPGLSGLSRREALKHLKRTNADSRSGTAR